MKVYLINLDKDGEKLSFMERQLLALGVEFQRVPGVNGAELQDEIREKTVNGFAWWCAVGRQIVPAEIGCALSHYGIYENLKEPACILEDDVELRPDFVRVLDRVGAFLDATRSQVVLLGDHFGSGAASGKTGIVRITGGYCADGYVITPLAAQILKTANMPLEVPCDHWGRWVRWGLIELYQVLPPAVAQRQDIFGSSTDVTNRTAHRPKGLSLVAHKFGRAVGLAVDEIRWRIGR